MKPEQMNEALEAAAQAVGVRVRYEPLAPGGVLSGGGLCRIKGEWHLIIDKKTSAPERLAMLTEALAGFEGIDQHLSPKLRALLEARRASLRGDVAVPAPASELAPPSE